jgi:hypothetical protein
MINHDHGVVENLILNRIDCPPKKLSNQLAWIVLISHRKLLTALLKRDRNGYQLIKNICGR